MCFRCKQCSQSNIVEPEVSGIEIWDEHNVAKGKMPLNKSTLVYDSPLHNISTRLCSVITYVLFLSLLPLLITLSALGVQLMQYALLMKFELEDETDTLEAFIWKDAVSNFTLFNYNLHGCKNIKNQLFFCILYIFRINKINNLDEI